jgi:hypothetical protein
MQIVIHWSKLSSSSCSRVPFFSLKLACLPTPFHCALHANALHKENTSILSNTVSETALDGLSVLEEQVPYKRNGSAVEANCNVPDLVAELTLANSQG